MEKLSDNLYWQRFMGRPLYESLVNDFGGFTKSLIKERQQALEALDNKALVKAVIRFFEIKQPFMDEMNLCDAAFRLSRLFKLGEPLGIMDEAYERGGETLTFREDVIRDFSKMCITQSGVDNYKPQCMKEDDFKFIGTDGGKSIYRAPVSVRRTCFVYKEKNDTDPIGRLQSVPSDFGLAGPSLSGHLMITARTGESPTGKHVYSHVKLLIDLGQCVLERKEA